MQEILVVNGVSYPVRIIREERTNSTGHIGRKGVTIRLPLSMNREESFRQLFKMKEWARKKLEEKPIQQKNKPLRTYKDGESLTVWGTVFQLRIMEKEKQSSSARCAGNELHLKLSSLLSEERKQHHAAVLLSRLLGEIMLPRLKEKINALNDKHFQQEINNISLKNTSSRWGSCNPRGRNINISTRLFFAPDGVIDSVCIHELAHLIEKGHSERFWGLVEKAMPDYKEKDRWLKEHGHECGF